MTLIYKCDICGGNANKSVHRTYVYFNIEEVELDGTGVDDDLKDSFATDVCDVCAQTILKNDSGVDATLKNLKDCLVRSLKTLVAP